MIKKVCRLVTRAAHYHQSQPKKLDMKAKVKSALVIAGIAIALVAASQSVNPERKSEGKRQTECFSESDVRVLMDANGWTFDEATQVLTLSCGHAAQGNRP
jgi:hypothetical protein